MESDLKAILDQRFGENPEGVNKRFYGYALSTRQRGRDLCNAIKHHTAITWAGSKVLEIGCAYAGFLIRTAELGSQSWGVEIDDKFFNMGVANTRGEPGEINLIHGDILAASTLDQLPHDFDLILINDVFEHIYDTFGLMKSILALSKPGTRVAFAIPNPLSTAILLEECHTCKPGASLFNIAEWFKVFNRATVFYRPWNYYKVIFDAFGASSTVPWNNHEGMEQKRAQALSNVAQAMEAVKTSGYDHEIRDRTLHQLSELHREMERDLEIMSKESFWWKYLVGAWQGHITIEKRPEDESLNFS